MAVLSQVDIDHLQQELTENGYAVIRDVVSRPGLADLATHLTADFERRRTSGELFNGGGMVSGHLNCFPGATARFVYDELRDYGIVDLARAVEPGAEDHVRITMNWNLPGSVAQHYHTDGFFTEAFLICNIAVVDTGLVNGAIDVLPGTNQRFYKFYEYALQRKYKLTTRVPMRAGDILLRMSTLWHRGMPNRSSAPRPMMSVTFGEDSAPEGDPFALNDGEPWFFPNWYSTSRVGQLRERTFVAAPISYSAYRFVRSLYGNKGYSSF